MRPSLFKLEAFFEEYEHLTGMHVLCASDAETLTIEELLELSGERLDLGKISLGYKDVKGDESLRAAIADLYPGSNISVDNVLITVGGSEAIFLALQVLLGPGDEALVCRPAYQGLYEMAQTAGARVSFYDYEEPKGFAPDLGLVKRALAKPHPPKALVINSPHNPTGQAMDQETLRDILGRARSAGTSVIADEVFLGICLDSAKPAPSAVTLHPDAIVIGCLSKIYGLAGLRIGWLVGPKQFIQECKRLRYYTSLCPPCVVQELAEVALRNRSRILQRNQRAASENYKHALEWLDRHKEFFEWVRPQAGLVMLLRLKLPISAEEFARDLAERAKVFLLPCTVAFGMGEGYLRLGLGGASHDFRDGLILVDEYLKSQA